MEVSLYEDQPFPFTAEWYTTREHAPHLEQPIHQGRMRAVSAMVSKAIERYGYKSIADLGAGDGGTLSLLSWLGLPMWGYDLMEANVAHAKNVRGVDVRFLDFVDEPIDWADLTIITECLEHLEHPHAMVRRIAENSQAIIASSPAKETADSHDACHSFVWDMEGYAALIEQGGFDVIEHLSIDGGYAFQAILGVKR